jgi:lipopolysaccharide export system protein LptA
MRLLLKLLLLCVCISAFALPTDDTQVMQIVADSSQLNYKNRNNVYEGNVKIDQGTTHLAADRVTTQNNERHKLSEAIAYGTNQPAHYWTIPREGDKELHAYAKVIKFYPLKSTVILEGDVIVTQGENSFHGPSIIYNIKDQTVISPPTTQGRSTIIIEPNKIS